MILILRQWWWLLHLVFFLPWFHAVLTHPMGKGRCQSKKSPTFKSELSCCHGGFPAEVVLGSPLHLQGFCLWSALATSAEGLLQPFAGGVWEKEHEFCALRFWKRPVQVRLKDIFDRRWHSRNISIIWIITYSIILLVHALAGFMVRSCLQLLLPQLLVLSSH